jgi:hypothetical protein
MTMLPPLVESSTGDEESSSLLLLLLLRTREQKAKQEVRSFSNRELRHDYWRYGEEGGSLR